MLVQDVPTLLEQIPVILKLERVKIQYLWHDGRRLATVDPRAFYVFDPQLDDEVIGLYGAAVGVQVGDWEVDRTALDPPSPRMYRNPQWKSPRFVNCSSVLRPRKTSYHNSDGTGWTPSHL